MTINEYVSIIIKQIQVAKDDVEIEEVIQIAISNMTEKKINGFLVQRCMDKLKTAIEELMTLTHKDDLKGRYQFALKIIQSKIVRQVIED